jgi:hypothetical protein
MNTNIVLYLAGNKIKVVRWKMSFKKMYAFVDVLLLT